MSTYQSTDNPDGFKYQSTDNPDGSVQLIKLMIDLNTFHTFKIIISKIVLVLAAIDETNFVGI